MLTDWLIFLDLLEENNQNTSFLRLMTSITFGIIETHNYNYIKGDGSGNGNGDGNGSGNGYGDGDGNGSVFGNGNGDGYGYFNTYNEEH